MLVIDNTGPTVDAPVVGRADNVEALLNMLSEVRDARTNPVEQPALNRAAKSLLKQTGEYALILRSSGTQPCAEFPAGRSRGLSRFPTLSDRKTL